MTQSDPPLDQPADQRGAGQRRDGRPRNRRDDLLRAAFDLFAERGYRGTSLGAVAHRAGLTQQGLLHYFPNKETLLAEVLQFADDLDVRRVVAEPTSAASLDRLAELVVYDATRPDVVRSRTVLTAESLTENHPARAHFVQRYADLRRGVARSLRADLDGGLPDGLPVEQASALVVAMIEGLQLQWLLQPDEIDVSAAFTAFLDLLRKAD